MMLKEKSSPWARLKYLYVLPLAAIAVTAFARPEVSNELKEISKVKVNDLTEIVEVNEVENQVALSAREPEPVIIRSRETVEKPELQSPIKQHGVKNGKEPLFIIDGKETTGAVLQSISPDHISSIDVLKDVKAVELFGEKATNGVVIVTLLSEKEREELAKKPKKNVVEIAKDHISSETLILFDGKEVSNIDNINPEDVGMIRVYNPKNKDDKEAAPLFEKYGNKAKGGIVSISSKKPGETAGLYVAGVGARAQIINVQGQVNDSEGKPVAGAVIKIAGSNVGTVSDMEGKFSLEARESDYISVLFIGMKKAVTKVSPKLTVTLEKGE